MIFSSASFLAGFLPIVLAGYLMLRRFRYWQLSQAWLLLSSLVFYGYSGIDSLPVLLASIVVNFSTGYWLQQSTFKKTILTCGIVFNLGLLGFFKYWCFFQSQFSSNSCTSDFELPLAISFFTFQQIAWLGDVYRAKIFRVRLINYALFVAFFPQLIAGPIVHYRYVRKQFDRQRQRPKGALFLLGIIVFTLGLAKKVLLADPLAGVVDSVYAMASEPEHRYALHEIFVATTGYGLQLYFDFSGYADMAIGLAAMFGIRLPVNFRSPYRTTSMVDFWRCWHITLSRFLRDYLYIPLGGSFHGRLRRHLNLLITMLLGGLWHGAGWGFVIWGGAHGLLLVLNHLFRRFLPFKTPGLTGWVLTFIAVNLLWVLFRSESLLQTTAIYNALLLPETWLQGMATIRPWLQLPNYLRPENISVSTSVALLLIALIVVLQPVSSTRVWSGGHGKPGYLMCLFAGILLFFSIQQLILVEPAAFVYFRF